MEFYRAKLTVYFENPFWVGVFQRESEGRLEVCKLTFGAEPRDCELYELLLKRWHTLVFSPPVEGTKEPVAYANPKRMQRAAAKELGCAGIGTKAQQALQMQREQNKKERTARRKARDAAEQERQFQLRRKKRKEKHLGH